jgi:hypothetical protein
MQWMFPFLRSYIPVDRREFHRDIPSVKVIVITLQLRVYTRLYCHHVLVCPNVNFTEAVFAMTHSACAITLCLV